MANEIANCAILPLVEVDGLNPNKAFNNELYIDNNFDRMYYKDTGGIVHPLGVSSTDVSDSMQAHLAALDPHSQYTTEDEATDIAIAQSTASIAGHEALLDPHSQYTTEDEATDIAIAQSTASIAGHEALLDPHSQYTTEDEATDIAIAQSTASRAGHEALLNPHPQYELPKSDTFSWVDNTNNRVKDTAYVNTTGSAIQLIVSCLSTMNPDDVDTDLRGSHTILFIDGNQIGSYFSKVSFSRACVEASISPGSSYNINTFDNDFVIQSWWEYGKNA